MAIASPRPPAQDDPEALIPEARQRQRRRQLLSLAAVAVAVALGLGIYGAATGGGPLGTVRDSLRLGSTPKTCRSSQLKTQRLGFGLGIPASIGLAGIELTNTSGSACSLPGTPRISLFWHGQPLAVRQVHVADFFRTIGLPGFPTTPVAHLLRSGKSARIYFVWHNWCGPPTLRGIPLIGRVLHGRSMIEAARLQATHHPPLIVRFRFGNAPPFASLPGYGRPQCTSLGAPSTITATQPHE